MKRLKVLFTMAAILFVVAVFGQEVAPVQGAKFDFAKIWEIFVSISPYLCAIILTLFGTSEGLAAADRVKPNSVTQLLKLFVFKLLKKQADKIKK